MPVSLPIIKRLERVERRRIYSLPAVPIDYKKKPSRFVQKLADSLFEELLLQLLSKNKKLIQKKVQKKVAFQSLIRTAQIAFHGMGAVRYDRNKNADEWSSVRSQVIQKSVEAGLFTDTISKPGPKKTKMSRLQPTDILINKFSGDPWIFDPCEDTQYVHLYERGKEGKELTFDVDLPIARMTQRKLVRVNEVNNLYEVTYQKYSDWTLRFVGKRQLRPIHYAVFTGSFDLHGRIYTGKYGHQGLRQAERQTIHFSGTPCCELDYKGLHTRMLYHLNGMVYTEDPYSLWGWKTTEPLRMLAKLLINCLINAKSSEQAIQACNGEMNPRTKEGELKQGRSIEEALRLREALNRTGWHFRKILPLVYQTHSRIQEQFGKDRGIELMRIDSAIALDVLNHFAKQSIPCLGCHDSFLVPKQHMQELRQVMNRFYLKRVGFYPEISEVSVS